MQCPKCKNAPLKSGEIKAKQLTLDQCSICKGMWFDKGELTTLLGSKAKKDMLIPKFAVKIPDTKCPRCNHDLYEFCYPGTLTLIDACKQCDGVWLDNKEWQVISHERDESKNIHCPKCRAWQKPAESCAKCGVIIAKYQSLQAKKNITADPKTTNDNIDEQSYADGIPGLKGSLLRMIERTIKKLSVKVS